MSIASLNAPDGNASRGQTSVGFAVVSCFDVSQIDVRQIDVSLGAALRVSAETLPIDAPSNHSSYLPNQVQS